MPTFVNEFISQLMNCTNQNASIDRYSIYSQLETLQHQLELS